MSATVKKKKKKKRLAAVHTDHSQPEQDLLAHIEQPVQTGAPEQKLWTGDV